MRNADATIKRDSTGKAVLIYNLYEYPILKGIEIDDKFSFLKSIIKAYYSLNKDKPVNNKSMYKLYTDLLGYIRKNGYSGADIPKFHLNYNNGTLYIEVTDGTYDHIVLNGNKRTKDDVILRELTFNSDRKVLFKTELEKSLRNILSTNLFQQASLNLIYNKNKLKPDISIDLVEKSTRNLRFSLRTDNERNIQLYGEYRNENILGTNNEFAIIANGSLRDREYKFEVKSNRFFKTSLTYNLSVYYKFRDIYNYVQTIDLSRNEYERIRTGEYRDKKIGGSFLLGTQLEKIGTLYAMLSYDKLSRIVLKDFVQNQNDISLIKLRFGGKIDSEDKYPFPTKGTNVNYYYETAQNEITGSESYSKLLFDMEYYFPIGKRNILKPKLTFGFCDKTTPLIEHFSLGGQNSFMGMLEDELRGRQILLSSIEYRYNFPYKIFFDTYFALRYDLGQVWQNAEDIRIKDLRHGIGLSIMFDTPIGKANFSAGRSFLIYSKGIAKSTIIWGPYSFYFSLG